LVLVLIFGKEDDSVNDEFDPNDDGSPIYVDELIGDLNDLPDLEVNNIKFIFFFFIKIII